MASSLYQRRFRMRFLPCQDEWLMVKQSRIPSLHEMIIWLKYLWHTPRIPRFSLVSCASLWRIILRFCQSMGSYLHSWGWYSPLVGSIKLFYWTNKHYRYELIKIVNEISFIIYFITNIYTFILMKWLEYYLPSFSFLYFIFSSSLLEVGTLMEKGQYR